MLTNGTNHIVKCYRDACTVQSYDTNLLSHTFSVSVSDQELNL